MSFQGIEAKFRSTGFAELDKKLQYMHTAAANRIVTAAVRAGLRIGQKHIAEQIPKTIRDSIIGKEKGIGVTTKRKSSNGTSGKVGVGVGNTQKKAVVVANRGKRKGVGVSARNLHWFAMGTKDRMVGWKRIRTKQGFKEGRKKRTGNPEHFTGRIDETKWGGFVQRGMNGAQGAIFAKMAASITKNLAIAAERGTAGALEGLHSGD